MVREASSVAIDALPRRSTTAAVAADAEASRITDETMTCLVRRRWRESRPAYKAPAVEQSSDGRMAPLSDCAPGRDNSIQASTVGWRWKLSRSTETAHKREM